MGEKEIKPVIIIMSIGPYYYSNQRRLSPLSESDWIVVLAKCKKHIRLKLKQKTLSGAHAASNVGSDPIDHYLSMAYTKLLEGEWEWKAEFSFLEQMIRMIDSFISKQIDKQKTGKAKAVRLEYSNTINEFYITDNDEFDLEENSIYETQAKALADAAKGDAELEVIYDAICEGMKRADIAELLEKTPKQFDKLKEKLLNRVKKISAA